MKAVEYRHSWSSDTNEEDDMKGLFGELLVEYDTSADYEVEQSMLFRKENTFTWIDANGCSCWDGDWDGWELDLSELKTLVEKKIEQEGSYTESATYKVAKWVQENL